MWHCPCRSNLTTLDHLKGHVLAIRELYTKENALRDETKINRAAAVREGMVFERSPQGQAIHLMTPDECARFLHIEVNTLYVMKSQGRIPFRKVGHLLRFDRDEIIEWTKPKAKAL